MYRPKGLVNPYYTPPITGYQPFVLPLERERRDGLVKAFEEGCRAYEEALKAEGLRGHWARTPDGSFLLSISDMDRTIAGTLVFIPDEEESNDQ